MSLASYAACQPLSLTFWNGASIASLDTNITGLIRESTVNFDATIADVYCAGSRDGTVCLGICPNADLAGPGVRIAFYLQSFTNTLLIVLSHSDSAEYAWTATILTAAIVIPAMIQKSEVSLTLYHATLILNFATFSTVASLATAPLCWMWDAKALADEIKKEEKRWKNQPLDQKEQDRAVQRAREKGKRSRVALSIALIVQIALQWAWAIMLFTRPVYDQKACSADTTVFLFGYPFRAGQINSNPGWIWWWVAWVFFCIFVTFLWGVFLVFHSSRSARTPAAQPEGMIWKWAKRGAAGIICLLFLICSELQVKSNCVLGNENSDWGFGQITALLLAASPIWGIVVAAHEKLFNNGKDDDARSLAPTGSIRHRLGRSSTPASRRRSTRSSIVGPPETGIRSMAQVNVDPTGLRSRRGHTRALSSSDAGRHLMQPSPQLSSFESQAILPPLPFQSTEAGGMRDDPQFLSLHRTSSSLSYIPTSPLRPANEHGLMLTPDYGLMGSSIMPGRQHLAATYTSSHVPSDDRGSFDYGTEPSPSSSRAPEFTFPYTSPDDLARTSGSRQPHGQGPSSLYHDRDSIRHVEPPTLPWVQIELQAASEDSHGRAGSWASVTSLPESDTHVQAPRAATIRLSPPDEDIRMTPLLGRSSSSILSNIPPPHPSTPPNRYTLPSPSSGNQPSPTFLSPEYGTHRRRPSDEVGVLTLVPRVSAGDIDGSASSLSMPSSAPIPIPTSRTHRTRQPSYDGGSPTDGDRRHNVGVQPSYDSDPFSSSPRGSSVMGLQPPLSPARPAGPRQQTLPSVGRTPSSPSSRTTNTPFGHFPSSSGAPASSSQGELVSELQVPPPVTPKEERRPLY